MVSSVLMGSPDLRRLKKVMVVLAMPMIIALMNFGSASADHTAVRVYPLPLTELETVVSAWLSDSGFAVQRSIPLRGQIILSATKARSQWRLALFTHSPLVSRLEINAPDGIGADPLLKYLAEYSRQVSSKNTAEERQDIPGDILSKVASVACIKGLREGRSFQFTGVGVDKKGLLLCTGHDLKPYSRVSVVLNDGRVLTGTVIKLDSRLDLALISIPASLTEVVDLNRKNEHPDENEQLFSVGCPLNMKGVIHAGRLYPTPRRLNGLLLRQVDMTIQQGSSGSPVFDTEGNLVGIVKGRFRGTNDIGFLIPITTILDFMKEPLL